MTFVPRLRTARRAAQLLRGLLAPVDDREPAARDLPSPRSRNQGDRSRSQRERTEQHRDENSADTLPSTRSQPHAHRRGRVVVLERDKTSLTNRNVALEARVTTLDTTVTNVSRERDALRAEVAQLKAKLVTAESAAKKTGA